MIPVICLQVLPTIIIPSLSPMWAMTDAIAMMPYFAEELNKLNTGTTTG